MLHIRTSSYKCKGLLSGECVTFSSCMSNFGMEMMSQFSLSLSLSLSVCLCLNSHSLSLSLSLCLCLNSHSLSLSLSHTHTHISVMYDQTSFGGLHSAGGQRREQGCGEVSVQLIGPWYHMH